MFSAYGGNSLMLVGLKYMADVWTPRPIFAPIDDTNVNIKDIYHLNKKDRTFAISCVLFCLMLGLDPMKLKLKNFKHIVKTINKLIGRCMEIKTSKSLKQDNNSPCKNYWEDLYKYIKIKEIDSKEKVFYTSGLLITFEMACVKCLTKKIRQNSSNGSFIGEAMELSSKFVMKYLSCLKVRKASIINNHLSFEIKDKFKPKFNFSTIL